MSTIIRWAQGRVERNRANVGDPDREQNIKEIGIVAGRVVGQGADLALFGFVKKRTTLVDRIIGTDLPVGMEFAGASSRWTWVKDKADIVTKIHRDSVWRDDSARTELMGSLADNYATMRRYLGETLVEQTLHHDVHPFRDGRRAVFFRHPLVKMVDLHLFDSQKGRLQSGAVDKAEHDFPGISGPLNVFANSGLKLYAETDLLADTSAMHSLGVSAETSTNDLLFQHGAAVPDARQRDVDRICGQLEALVTATS